ncbi:MAG: hypothetical protein SPI53_04740 [Erysipelotrichaceae bacterium]|nr:hypothetical protein [Erysipelotrichaceae bacterium]
MNIKKIKYRLKNISFIGKTYEKFIGSKKVKKIENERRKSLKNDGLKNIAIIESALSESGVRFFLDFGSLLGIIRDRKFMEWDSDIDYAVYINDEFTWDKLEEILKGCGMKKLKQFRYNDEITEQTYINGKLTIDFFNHTEDEKNSYTYVYFNKKGIKYKNDNEYSVSKLCMYKVKGIKIININETDIHIPDEPEKYLASIYTDGWKIPNPNWVAEKGPSWNEIENAIAYLEH